MLRKHYRHHLLMGGRTKKAVRESLESGRTVWSDSMSDGCGTGIFTRLVPDPERILACCNLHDRHYVTKRDVNGKPISRRQADKQFYYCMIANGFSDRRAWLWHRSIRLVGWYYWIT